MKQTGRKKKLVIRRESLRALTPAALERADVHGARRHVPRSWSTGTIMKCEGTRNPIECYGTP